MPTLWESLEEPDILDTTEFEYLFSKDTTQEKRKPLSETYEKKPKAIKVFIVSLQLLLLCHCLVLHFKKTPFLFIVNKQIIDGFLSLISKQTADLTLTWECGVLIYIGRFLPFENESSTSQ